MNEFKSLTAALDAGDHYGTTMADLPAELYQWVERELGALGRVFPRPSAVAFAIVGNATAADNGSWQYSVDQGTTWIDIPTSGLSDSHAIVLPLPVNIRFSRAQNWFGTPGNLTARVSDGTIKVPSPGVQDISEETRGAGKWLRGAIRIAAQTDGTAFVAESTLTAGNLWDRMTSERRRIWAEDRDKDNDPALEQEHEREWELIVRRGDQERKVADLKRQVAYAQEMLVCSPRDELDKQALLDGLHQKLDDENRTLDEIIRAEHSPADPVLPGFVTDQVLAQLGPALLGDEWIEKLSERDKWLIQEAARRPNDVVSEGPPPQNPLGLARYVRSNPIGREQLSAARQRKSFMQHQHGTVHRWLEERRVTNSEEFARAFGREFPQQGMSVGLSDADVKAWLVVEQARRKVAREQYGLTEVRIYLLDKFRHLTRDDADRFYKDLDKDLKPRTGPTKSRKNER